MNTDAWLLHHMPSGDTSARLTLLSSGHGVLHCLYKGARTPRKRAMVQPFLPLWVELNTRNGWHFVSQLEPRGAPLALQSISLSSACYVNELVYHALKSGSACPSLYARYEQTMSALAGVTERFAVEMVLRRFEWSLLEECGYLHSFTHEACGRPLLAENHYIFRAGAGFVQAAAGWQGAAILGIAAGEWAAPGVLQAAKQIMRIAVDHCVDGKELKSRQLFVNIPPKI